MPSFFGYMFKYSWVLLIVFALITVLFLITGFLFGPDAAQPDTIPMP